MGSEVRVTADDSAGAPADSTMWAVGNAGFELAMTPMLLIDENQHICRANAAAAELFGTNDLAGRSIPDLFEPDDDLKSCADMRPLIAGEVNRLAGAGAILLDSGRRVHVSMWVDLASLTVRQSLFLVQLAEHRQLVLGGTQERGESHYQQLVRTVPGMSVIMFDHDLRLLKAGGEVLARGHYNAAAMPGKLLSEVVPHTVMALVEDQFRAALTGQEADFDYDSPVDGRQYRIRIRPVVDDHGTITSGLALSEDVTVERARQTLLEQMQQLSNVGTIAYEAAGGWRADDELIALLGLDSSDQALQAIDNLVLPDDREPTRAAYRAVLAAGGRTTVQYRVMHGKTGQLRHVVGAIQAVVDAEGILLRALATHADITEAVQAQAAKVSAAQARTLLLRSVSDAFTKSSDLCSMMQSIVDIATAVLGDGTVLRVFTADAAGVETDLVSNTDERAKDLMTACLRHSAGAFVAEPAVLDPAGPAGSLLSSLRGAHGRREFEQRLGGPGTLHIVHFISAAVRHDGVVLGYLHVHRDDLGNPYQDGDDHLIQILADRIGSAIAESRVRELLERQRAERSAFATRLHELTVEQRELLEQLSGVEDRERMLLAEAIHDGPMQLVVAVMMRLETLSMNGGPIDQERLDTSIETLETSIRNLRTLIIALTPPDLSRGLGVALRQLAEGIFMGTATEIAVRGLAHVNLTALSKVNAHRILREALVNARKHASAQHVVLELIERDKTVIARLTDDGVGAATFDAGPGHLGMATMRARADAEGARLDITCTPGTGTTVVLTLPTAVADADR